MRTGTPRKDPIGGWFGGKPVDCGCWARSSRRSGSGWWMSRPRMPRPWGRSPIAARPSSSMPVVTNSTRKASLPITPTAPYRASVSWVAASTIRVSTECRSRSDEIAVTASRSALAEAGSLSLCSGGGTGPVCRMRSDRTPYGKCGLQVPAHADPATGELGPAQPQVQPASARGRPGPRRPGAADVLQLVHVDDDLAAPAGHDAPAVLPLVVELVDLEGEHAVASVGPEQAVRRGADDDRVVNHRVIHRHDVGAVRGGQRDAASDARVQQTAALVLGQVDGLLHGGLL